MRTGIHGGSRVGTLGSELHGNAMFVIADPSCKERKKEHLFYQQERTWFSYMAYHISTGYSIPYRKPI
jgi:hypothetical protein